MIPPFTTRPQMVRNSLLYNTPYTHLYTPIHTYTHLYTPIHTYTHLYTPIRPTVGPAGIPLCERTGEKQEYETDRVATHTYAYTDSLCDRFRFPRLSTSHLLLVDSSSSVHMGPHDTPSIRAYTAVGHQVLCLFLLGQCDSKDVCGV